MSSTVTDVKTVGERLVELCRQGNNRQAIEELYADDIVSVEACDMPASDDCPGGSSRTIEGIDAVLGKTDWWYENHTVHSGACRGPYCHRPDRFAVVFNYDVTFKPANQRMQMEEVGVYTVRDGKVSREEFYYTMPGM